jgi:chemotaxis protein MotB
MQSMSIRFANKTMALTLLSVAVITSSGCHQVFVPADQLAASQNQARELYAKQQQIEQQLAATETEKQFLGQHLADVENQLLTANARLENLLTERDELKERYARSLLESDGMFTGVAGTALDGFEFDATTGLNRFENDVLFDLGSDEIRPEQEPVIRDFASAVNEGAAAGMKILIVGHTDDQRIARPETAAKHPTNWHLSTDRSSAVILALIDQGVDPQRIASMGYSEFQPLEFSHDEFARQRNRRVELYVVPDDPSVAIWDPASSRN